MKDKKACIFYFLMTIILLDFGTHLKSIFLKYPAEISNQVFSVLLVKNTGSAFSLLQNHSDILAYFGFVVIFLIALQVFKNITFDMKTSLLSLILFSAGALGNAIERVQFGHVVDYIKLNFINFPVFNAFDIMICVGIFLYCMQAFLDFKKEQQK